MSERLRDISSKRRAIAALTDRVHGLTAALLGPGADAEDACQETILSALRSANHFDSTRGRLEPWLFSIARRRCLDMKRRGTVQLAHDPPAPGRHRTEAIRARLDAALAAMEEGRRVAFVLVVMQDLTVAEAADLEGVPAGTIKSRVARARSELRRTLEPEHDSR